MGKVMGRPRMEDPKSTVVSVKMNKEELKRLRDYADKHNMTATEVIKTGLEMVYNKPEK